MSHTNHQERLDAVVARRDAAKSTVQQLQGRLAAAEERAEAVKAECREKGLTPERLPAAIQQLEQRFARDLAAFEAGVAEVENKIAPFGKENRP